MYVLGAVEILIAQIAPQISVGQAQNDARIFGTVFLLVLTGIAALGMRQINRFAVVFLVCVLLAISTILIGLLASNREGLPRNEVVGFPGLLGENFPPGNSSYPMIFIIILY